MASIAPMFTATLQREVAEAIKKGTQSGEKVAAWEHVQGLLLAAGVAWKAQVPPEFVGVHPDNRSSLGVGGSEAHHLGSKILKAGWSWKKASDATAVDAPPPPQDAGAKAFNERLQELGGGYIPPLAQLRHLSIGGSHTNTFLRAVKAGALSAVPSIAGADGRLDAEQLALGRPGFREALEKEVSKAAGREVVPPGTWLKPAASGSSGSGTGASSIASPPTIAKLHSPAHQAREAGFTESAFVAPKKATETTVWVIKALTDEKCTLGLMHDGRCSDEQEVETAALLSTFRLHKGKVTQPLSGWDASVPTGSPATSAAWATDGVKGAVAMALRAAYMEREVHVAGLELLQQPSGVKSTQKFNKHALVLVPASQRVDRCKSETSLAANALSLGFYDVAGTPSMFSVSPHFVAPEGNKQPWVAPFWLVEAGAGEAVNMELVYEQRAVGEHMVQVPLMRNMRPINAGERLVWDKTEKPAPKNQFEAVAGAAAGGKKRRTK